MKNLILILALLSLGATYQIDVPDKYVPYLQERATEEKMTIKELLENSAKGIAKSRINKKYEEKEKSKSIDDKIKDIK